MTLIHLAALAAIAWRLSRRADTVGHTILFATAAVLLMLLIVKDLV